MFRSSRKFFISVAALTCLLGALTFAQNAQKPQAGLTADDFNQFTWRWVGPMTFSGRVTATRCPAARARPTTCSRPAAASGRPWTAASTSSRSSRSTARSSMGWLAIAPSNPNILYLGTGEPMHARASTHGNGMWKSTDAGKTWTHIGLEKSYFIPMVAVDSKNPDIVYVAAEGKLYDNEMDCERGLFKSIDGGKTWTNLGPMKDRGVGDFVIDPRNSNVIIAASYKHYRRAWTYDRPRRRATASSSRPTAARPGRSWPTGLPAKGRALGRTGLAIYEKNPNIVYARVDEEVSVGFAERDGVANFRRGGGGGRGGGGRVRRRGRHRAVQDGREPRAVQGVQDQRRAGAARAEVHAGHRRRRGRAGEEVQRAGAGQGLRVEERRRRREAATRRPASSTRRTKDLMETIARGREAGQEAGGGGRFDRGQGPHAARQPHGARDPLHRRRRQLAAGQAERRRVPHRRPGQDLEADDRVQAGDARPPTPPPADVELDAAAAQSDSVETVRQAQTGGQPPASRPWRAGGGAGAGRPRRPGRRQQPGRAPRRSTRPRAATTAASSSTRTTTRSSTAATRTPRCRTTPGRRSR